MADQHIYLERVKKARLPLEFAILDISLRNVSPELSYFTFEQGKRIINHEMVSRLETFVEQAIKFGFTKVEEHGTKPEHYQETVMDYIQRSISENMVYLKKRERLLSMLSVPK